MNRLLREASSRQGRLDAEAATSVGYRHKETE